MTHESNPYMFDTERLLQAARCFVSPTSWSVGDLSSNRPSEGTLLAHFTHLLASAQHLQNSQAASLWQQGKPHVLSREPE